MSRKRFKPGRRKVATVLGTTSALALSQWVQAEAAGDQPTDTLAEVIVTATKRETNVQDTPVADTVFSQSALDENHVSEPQNPKTPYWFYKEILVALII